MAGPVCAGIGSLTPCVQMSLLVGQGVLELGHGILRYGTGESAPQQRCQPDSEHNQNRSSKLQSEIIKIMESMTQSSFASQFFRRSNETGIERWLLPIKKGKVELLHSTMPYSPRQTQKPLLHYTAYHNSPTCSLYLLQKGDSPTQLDHEGKSAYHWCAYTGHIDVFKTIRNHVKIARIYSLNQQFIHLLTKAGFKRTDFKSGKLKISVSEAKLKIFQGIQQEMTEKYQIYVFGLMQETVEALLTPAKDTNRNCFHLACLNRYKGCYITLESMLEELSDINVHLDQQILQRYEEAGHCQQPKDRIDPRLIDDALTLISEIIPPVKLQNIRKDAHHRNQHNIKKVMASKDSSGHTVLYIASENGCTAILNILRKWEGTIHKEQDKSDLIKIACHNLARSHIMDLCQASKDADPNKMNFLLSCGEDLNKKKTIFGTFALLQAVKSFEKNNSLEPVTLLLQSGADPNVQDTNGWTILHHACEKGLKSVIGQIFDRYEKGKIKKIGINKLTNKHYHILHLAAISNHPQVIELLLRSETAKKLGLRADTADGDGCNMLHHAARKGSLAAVMKVLQLCGHMMPTQDRLGNTALHHAAANNHADCIQHLLLADSDNDTLQTTRNSKGKMPRDLTVNKKLFENAFGAARKGDVNQLRRMIQERPQLRELTTPNKKRTLLILAVINKHLLVVKLLAEAGVDPTQKDITDKTARDYAEALLNGSKDDRVLAKNMMNFLP